MIVVIASTRDHSAHDFAACWEGAAVCTPDDLSTPGWCHYLSAPDASTAVVSGKVVSSGDIEGVLTRLPRVQELDLPHIIPGDREYVASEMNAFLISWLSSVPCHVLNRPACGSLSGPNWRPEQWVRAAARVGIAARAQHRCVPSRPGVPGGFYEDSLEIIVVGTRVFGTADLTLTQAALRLAAAAEVDLLGIKFSAGHDGYRFLEANLWPELTAPGVAEAVKSYFLSSKF